VFFHSFIHNKVMAEYDNDYLQWKDWDDQAFCVLTAEQGRYFEAELGCSGALDLPPGARVLEIGFGQGCFLTFAQSRQWQVTGTEVNPHLVSMGQARGLDVHGAHELSTWPDGSFDLVVAFDVLEHVPQAEALGFLRDVMRVLKPGARAVLRFPNGDSPFGLVHQNADVTHVNAIGRGKVLFWAQALKADVLALRGQAQPVMGVGPVLAVYRLAVWPVRKLLNLFVRVFFLGGAPIDFSASNVVAVLRKPPAV
jgi:2-polyprenyl-3-methyl-5-hydroxy-6-metoxy-1,4-benzoquinol methylase